MAPKKREPSKPKQPRFLIALFLAKSKPSNLSTQEYISSLRSCVQEGRRLDGPGSSHSNVNTAEFWRIEFKRSEEAQTELRAKIFELEKMLDAGEQTRSVIPAGVTSQRKRRRDADETEGETGVVARKRSRMTVEPTLQDTGGFLETPVNGKKSPSDHEDPFLQRFYFLQQLMSHTNVEFKVLATVLCQVSSDIRRIICSFKSSRSSESTKNLESHNRTARNQQQKTTQVPSSVDEELDTKLMSIARIFPYLLNSLDKTNQTAEDRGLQGQVVYSYIEILRDLLTQICTLSASQEQENNRGPCRSAEGHFTRTARRNPASPIPPSSPDKTALKLSNLLLALTSALDNANAADNAILEGFLFFLLTRVGTALKVFVFGSDCEDSLGPNPQIEANADNFELDEKKIEAQAPYLVYLLDRLVRLAAPGSHQCSRVSSISLTPPLPPQIAAPSARFARPSLTRLPTTVLQSTLLNAVFGSNARAVEFSEALTPPLPTEEQLCTDYTENILGKDKAEGVVGDWFKMEVWRIIGWNVLSERIGL
ncbi:hypothetical protein MMC29_005234 [Sticta canariensis]|nr:hypothetical protein [Sticta canariensis]